MNKRDRVAAQIQDSVDGLSPYYLGFFERFNRAEFFEAHDVLEQLWLKDKYGPNGMFYKGLIQLAGAFVHVQKKRTGPATALFSLAAVNLGRYATVHERLNVGSVLNLIGKWKSALSDCGAEGPGLPPLPRLSLKAQGSPGH